MSTLEQYRNMLYVNKHRLDDELEIQPDIMGRISMQVVTRNSRMLTSKEELAKIEGRIGEELKEDDAKLTVALLDAKIKRDPERIRAWQAYLTARADHENWLGLLEAWRQKGYSLKTLADLYAAQYFSLNSTGTSERQIKREEDGNELRSALRRAGQRDRQDQPLDETKAPQPRRRALV